MKIQCGQLQISQTRWRLAYWLGHRGCTKVSLGHINSFHPQNFCFSTAIYIYIYIYIHLVLRPLLMIYVCNCMSLIAQMVFSLLFRAFVLVVHLFVINSRIFIYASKWLKVTVVPRIYVELSSLYHHTRVKGGRGAFVPYFWDWVMAEWLCDTLPRMILITTMYTAYSKLTASFWRFFSGWAGCCCPVSAASSGPGRSAMTSRCSASDTK